MRNTGHCRSAGLSAIRLHPPARNCPSCQAPARAFALCLALLFVPPAIAARATDYDYVVVGAGAAGCVLAARLTEDPAVRVLLLEAGTADSDENIRRPAAYRSLARTRLNWNYASEPDAELGLRSITLPAGRVWGGGSSISAMVYVRGAARDFDRWNQGGLAGWGYAELLPYFLKPQNQERGASQYHGTGGPLNVADPRYVAPVSEAFIAAAEEAGIAKNPDFNGPRADGAGLFQLTQKGGQRHSAADAYLRGALQRGNLVVVSEALVARVLIENLRAVGVEYLKAGLTVQARATREILLCAGAFGSPAILMRTGIGPAEALRRAGLPVLADSPGVGRNLQDHPRFAVVYRSKLPLGPASEKEKAQAERDFAERRAGPLTSTGIAAGAFVSAGPAPGAPGLLVYLSPNEADRTLALTVVLLHPESRGEVRLRSAKAEDPPEIHLRYLAEPADAAALVRGVRLARRIAATQALEAYRGEELSPGGGRVSDEQLTLSVREGVTTFFHAAGTCRMGADAGAVVDSELRVRGVRGLRVIDASIMPVLVGAPTLPATLAIAEKGADLVKRSQPQQAAGRPRW